jgi:hypothetical protein
MACPLARHGGRRCRPSNDISAFVTSWFTIRNTPSPLDTKKVPISGDPSSFSRDEASCWERVRFLISAFLFVMMVLIVFVFVDHACLFVICYGFLGKATKTKRTGNLSRSVWSEASPLPWCSIW